VEEFYEKYRRGIRCFIARSIDDQDVAEELTNDVLLAAYISLPSFNHKCSEFSFICSIAKHRIIDYYRKKKLKTVLFSANPMFEEIADMALSPERDVLKNELKDEIKKTMSDLSEGYQKILRLKYVKGFRVDQIAKLMELSVKAVESRLVRARRQFQATWTYDRKKVKETVEAKRPDRD
jgi:RNA polymerase sigma-70 factor (ECF subfamily)